MKTALIISITVILLASCASTKLPPAPDVSAYYDTTELKLVREHHRLIAEKKQARKFISKQNAAVIGGTLFGVYCILAWRYEIE